MDQNWEKYREKIIGLGEHSSRKSYYPELQEKIDKLEISQQNLLTIINSISDGIVLHDKLGKIILLNKQAQQIMNLPEEEMTHFTIADVSSPQMNPEELVHIWQEVIQGTPKMIEWVVKKYETNEEVPVQVSINRTLWNDEYVLVAAVRDFTERKKYEEEIIIARQKAEESDKLKTAFLANLSHEIRTPMNAILGFSDLLHNPNLDQNTRDNFVNIIHERGNHLLGIINDIIEMSKIETGQTTLHLAVLELNSRLETLYNSLKVIVPAYKPIEFHLLVPPRPMQIITDEVKLCQILTNLITNAFKYTEKGSVEFGYKSYNEKTITFYVKDTGEGIEKKYHQMIFDRFNRIETDLTVKEGGSGIGLAISRAYVEMLGGEIKVESEPGKGSTFSFTLPINSSGEDIKPVVKKTVKAEDISLNDFVLIAEDDDYNYLYLESLFPKEKFKLVRAFNGQEAVEICRKLNISVVLMDLKMPIMNGYDALKHIKSFKPNLIIIAQSAFVTDNDDLNIKSAGFDGFVAKPINKEHLFELIKNLTTGNSIY